MIPPNYTYEIQIGIVGCMIGRAIQPEPQQTIYITDEQYEIIKQFAHTKKDKDLNTVYILNDCEFKIVPRIIMPNQ